MGRIYFLIFWIPAVASAVMLLAAWRTDMLRRPLAAWMWFAAAVLLQFQASLMSPLWAVALVGQVVLALYLAIRFRL